MYAVFVLCGFMIFGRCATSDDDTIGANFWSTRDLTSTLLKGLMKYEESKVNLPTCGWTAKISSQEYITLDSVYMRDAKVNVLKWGTKTFYIGSTDDTADLSPPSPNAQVSHEIEFTGDFAQFNGDPLSNIVTAHFTCVCLGWGSSSSSTPCKMPTKTTTQSPTTPPSITPPSTTPPPTAPPTPTTLPPSTAPPTPTTPPPTAPPTPTTLPPSTAPPTPTTPPPTTPPPSPTPPPTTETTILPTDPTQAYFEKESDLCYTGPHVSTYTHIKHCVFKCVSTVSCVGVNDWTDQGRCDLVEDDSVDQHLGSNLGSAQQGSNLAPVAVGCEFYRVLWKA